MDSLDGVSSNSNMSTTANMGMGMSPSMGISSMAQMGSPPDIKPDINSLVSQSFYPYGIQHPMSQSQASPGSQPMMSPGLHSPSSSVTSPSMMSIGSLAQHPHPRGPILTCHTVISIANISVLFVVTEPLGSTMEFTVVKVVKDFSKEQFVRT